MYTSDLVPGVSVIDEASDRIFSAWAHVLLRDVVQVYRNRITFVFILKKKSVSVTPLATNDMLCEILDAVVLSPGKVIRMSFAEKVISNILSLHEQATAPNDAFAESLSFLHRRRRRVASSCCEERQPRVSADADSRRSFIVLPGSN